MHTIYKQAFLFTGVTDNWEGKHLVLNGNPSCVTFHQLYHDTCPNLFDLGLEWNGMQSLMRFVEWDSKSGGWGRFHSKALKLVR